MKLGTTLFFENVIGYKESMKKASKAGFKFVDFDLTEHNDPPLDKEKEFFGEVNRVAEGEGISFSQAHAPYVKGLPTDYEYLESKEFFERVKNSIRRANMIKAPYLVYHPIAIYQKGYEKIPYDYSVVQKECFERNLNVLAKFKSVLEDYDVNLALENVDTYDFVNRKASATVCCTSKECNAFIDALGDEHYSICLDAGHLNVVDAEKMSDYIKNVGKRIKVLHLHDNFGVQNDWFGGLDRHLLPFMGSLDWEGLANDLKGIGFDGVYSFESIGNGPVEFIDEYYNHVYKAGKIIFYK